jgi:hypothetical protein
VTVEIHYEFIPELDGRAEFARVTCDYCERTYPKDGQLSEGAHVEAEVYEGWDLARRGTDKRDACPSCWVDGVISRCLLP